MRKKIFKYLSTYYRSDGMSVNSAVRMVQLDKFHRLLSCMYGRCLCPDKTCDKCPYSM